MSKIAFLGGLLIDNTGEEPIKNSLLIVEDKKIKYAITEMYALNKAGLTAMETIVAATKNGAEMLKIDNITGTLEVGKFADLLVIDGNPLEDIHNISVENMKVIMKEGAFVKR